eukprot:gene6002-biopygen6033
MEPLDVNGKVASRFAWFLKSTEEHDEAADGAANCADQPFHLMDRNATWVVDRPATAEDDDGEVSDEYPRDGNSLTGLAGCDGKDSAMYYWALRKFVYELNKRFLMRGTKEKNDMLKAFPAGKGDLEWKDLEDIVRVQDKIKDEVEEWSLSIVQDLLRRQSCPYSVYELKNFGIDLNGVVTAIRIRAAESKKITAKEKPSEANTGFLATSSAIGITTKEWGAMTDGQKGLVSANVAGQQPDMNTQFEALAKEIKDKLAQDMDCIKSRVSSSSASVRGLSDDEEEVSRAAIQEEFEDDECPLPRYPTAQGHVHVTMGSAKKMQGFTPKAAGVTDVIGEGWEPREVRNPDRFPHYHRCNVVGKPMMALPTIMATQSSHAFRDDRAPGTVVSKDGTGLIQEVDLDEKARAMGYSADVLRRSGLSDVVLQVVLGLAMDRRAMEALYAASEVNTTSVVRTQVVHPTCRAISLKPFMKQDSEWVEVKQREPMQAGTAAWLRHSRKFAAEQSAAVEECSWDGICQRLVKEAAKDRRGLGQKKPSLHAQAQRRRTWQLELWRPSQYEARARTTFVRTRVAREPRIEIPEWAPAERVAPVMRLPALKDTVRFTQLTANLMEQQSQREQQSYYAKKEALLHPLDIKPFMYRWSLDVLKPGKVAPSGHRRILVMTELHYTRFVIAVPLPDKEASTIAWAFRNHVLSVFGAPAECLVDGGGEFEGEFEKLCESCLIDRRFLWAIILSYNAAKQQSTGVAPFTMLFAQEPTVPPELKGKHNLEFDTMPKSDADTRVADLLDTGVVTLEDRTGLKEKATVSHIAACFLQIKDKYDFQEAVPGEHHACHVCKRSDNDSKMLLCDRCNKGYHLWCLHPKLKKVPDGEWHGPCCEDKPEAARAERRNSGDDSTDAAVMERWAGKLKRATSALLEKTPSPTTVLEFDVGPRRVILKGKAKQPWLAVSLAQLQHKEEHHCGAQKRADLGTVSGLKQLLDCIMPGSWHDGHLTRLSRKCAKQKERSRSLRSEGEVPAMSKDVQEARGEVQKMKRSQQVKEASLLDWGLELVMTVRAEVKRLSVEVDWSEIQTESVGSMGRHRSGRQEKKKKKKKTKKKKKKKKKKKNRLGAEPLV